MASKKEIEFVVKEVFGPEALPITNYLKGKKNVSEFIIAKEIEFEIHRVRQILYKLLEEHVVVFLRKKDKEKGWYICYWTLNEDEIPYIKYKIKKNKIEKIQERLAQESGDNFYMCKNACTRANFDSAFEINFKCPDCGEIMHLQDNNRTKEFLKTRIEEMKKEIEKEKEILNKQDNSKRESIALDETDETENAEETKTKKPLKKTKKTKKKTSKKKTTKKKKK